MFYLADTLADLGAIEEARPYALVADALEVPPRSAVRFALGIALARCGIRDAAVARLRQCVAGDPHDRYGARLALAALNEGAVPTRASDGFIDRLYALRRSMGRRGRPTSIPWAQLVADKVIGERFDIVDAGCGTGLVGALVRDRARHLLGVDLSASMLERARSKSVYDELHKGDLTAFLQARPQVCDVVTCAATLIHFRELGLHSSAAASALRVGGSFIFTVFPNERG